MKKLCTKLLCLLLVLALAAAMLPLTAFAAELPFKDVSKTAWYINAVTFAYENGLFSGTSETTFAPNAPMTRGMFVRVLANATDNYSDEDWQGDTGFTDVPAGIWYSAPIKWAASTGIVSGVGNGLFAPEKRVTREQMARIFYAYAAKTGNTVSYSNATFHTFPDKYSVSSWAKTGMKWATDHKIINGSKSGGTDYLAPGSSATRAQVAQVFMNAQGILVKRTVDGSLEIPDKDPSDIDPVETFKAPVNISQTAAGVSVRGVQFNPQDGYGVQAVFANNKLFSTESAQSIAQRTGAVVAVNGAFYQCYNSSQSDYLTTFTTMVNNGELVCLQNAGTTEKPIAKPAFVIDSNGRASIETFTRVKVGAKVYDAEGKLVKDSSNDEIGRNLKISAASPAKMTATRAFGTTVPGTVLNAAVVGADGVVTKTYHNAANVPIPETGYVLYEYKLRSQWDDLVSLCKVGCKIELSVNYTGSRKQDIVTALSCGPTLVKDGKPYANYAGEGFTDPHVTSGSASRMAIGVKADGTVVIVNATCTLGQLGSAMAALGCQGAMNLDGGASCALYVQGSARVPAGRPMSNMLVFTRK